MNVHEICYSYRHAVNKIEQISILAQLTASDEDTIIEILRQNKVINDKDLKHRICCRCGREYRAKNRKGVPVCPECRDTNRKILDIEHVIRRNNAKIAEHIRNMGKLTATNERLREEIEELRKNED